MQTLPRSRSSSVDRFDPEEIKRLVAVGRERGLIQGGDAPVKIEKDGEPVATAAGLKSVWMDITPDRADRWLANNFRNRPISEDVVNAYARDMRSGQWAQTHQGIAFNDRDELIDGQHRLKAIVLAGVTVRMMVTFGLPSKIEGREMTTMDAVDRGRTRSVADQLKIQHGMKDGSLIASICSSLANICSGERTRRLSVGQTLEIFRAFEPAVLWTIEKRSREPGLKMAGVLAAFAFADTGRTDGKIAEMFGDLVEGRTAARSAMHCLRKFLVSPEATLLTRGTNRGLAELVLQAIFLEEQGVEVDVLEMKTDGIEHFRAKQRDRVERIKVMLQLPERKS